MSIMTEDEAKTKICHQTFAVQAMSLGNGFRECGPWLCIASACMAWRKKDQIGIGPDGKKRDRDMDGRTKWVDRGYCGLAGGSSQ